MKENRKKMKTMLALAVVVLMAGVVFTTVGVDDVDAAEGQSPVKIGDQEFETLDAAISAANSMKEEVTVEIYGKVDYSSSTPDLVGPYDVISFIGMTEDAEISITRNGSTGYISGSNQGNDCDVIFTNLTLSKPTGYYAGDAGFMNMAFSTYRVGSVSYIGCVFSNGACAAGPVTTYTNCHFYMSHDKYSLWAYGAEIIVDGGVFHDVRAIKMYAENAAKTTDLTVKNADMSECVGSDDVEGRPAIVLTYGEKITLINNTYPTTGVLGLDGHGSPDGTPIDVDLDDIACFSVPIGDCGVLVDGKIYTTLSSAYNDIESDSTVTLFYNTDDEVELPLGVTFNKNGYTADNVTFEAPVAMVGDTPYADLQEALYSEADEVTLVSDNFVSETSIIIPKGVTLIIPAGKTVTATIESGADGSTITLTNVKAGANGITIACGSLIIEMDLSEADEPVILSGDVVVSGTCNVSITIGAGSNVTVPSDKTLILNEPMTVISGEDEDNPTTITILGDLDGTGQITAGGDGETPVANIVIEAKDESVLEGMLSEDLSDIEITEPTPEKVDSEDGDGYTVKDVQDALLRSDVAILDGPVIVGEEPLVIESGKTLKLEDGAVVAIMPEDLAGDSGLTVKGHIEGDGMIIVLGYLELDGADVRVPVIEVGDDAYIYVKNAKEMSVSGNQTADLGVGYGNTLVLKDLEVPAGKNVQAWGTVIVEGTVTVEDGATFDVYAGGNAQIKGDLVIEGDALVQGKMDVDGSVKVYNENGGAAFELSPNMNVIGAVLEAFEVLVQNNDSEMNVNDLVAIIPSVNVNEDATFDVLKARSKDASVQNALSSIGLFNVDGTLTVTGDVSGFIMDSGTFNINGSSSDDLLVIMADGTSMTVGSIDGMMMVMPLMSIQDIEDMTDGVDVLGDIPMVVLADLGGVTVTASYETVNYDNPDEESDIEKLRAHLFGLDVSGTLKAINDDVKAFDEDTAGSVAAVMTGESDVPATVGSSYINIGDITLGKNTCFDMVGSVVVNGTVTAVADYSMVTTDGAVDVEGTIVIGDDCITNPDEDGDSTDLQVNGAKYTVTDNTEGETTTYYTTLENALAAVSTADENEVYILGEIDVDTVIEVPAEATVTMDDGSEITIGVDGKITVADTAELVASDGEIDVEGMLVIIDKESGFEAPGSKDAFTYQVYTVDGDTETYSGLVLALQNATEGDVITLKQNADITKSVTIPEGVTLVVPRDVDLFIGDDEDDVTLTVVGKLEVQTGGNVIKAEGSEDVSLSIVGVVTFGDDNYMDYLIPTTSTDKVMVDDFVLFEKKVDGKVIDVLSNLTYASENADEGTVIVYGDVSAGDITFTMGERATEFEVGFGKDNSTITVGTMTLVSNGKADITFETVTSFINGTINGTVTGTVASAVGSVDMNKVSGITVAVGIATDVDGTTDYMTVFGTLDGKMSVATGTVTVNDDASANTLTVGSSKDDILTIASGAIIAVPEYAQIVIDAMDIEASVEQYYALVVDGTLSFEKGTIDYVAPAAGSDDEVGEVLVNGTMTVKDSAITMDGVLEVLGNLDVIDDEELSTSFTVDGVLIIGSAPALGANGTVTGPIAIDGDDTSIVIAYAGADVSAAVIDPSADGTKSEAKSTEIVINGIPYMTVYVDKDANVPLTAIKKYIEAEGFDTSDVAWGDYDGASIGQYPTVEGTVEAEYIGLTVSAGVGLQVYIDGLAIENYKSTEVTGYTYAIQLGTHTVSFAVESGYDGSAATITVNGVAVSNNGTFTLDVDDKSATIIASGAVPAQSGSTVVVDDADDGMALTDILLIVLVVLIVIMAIIVALRMMRS